MVLVIVLVNLKNCLKGIGGLEILLEEELVN